MKILQIESLIINIKALLVLAMSHILCVVSQNGYYGHFNDMNCNAIVIWWYELWRCVFYILCLKKSM